MTKDFKDSPSAVFRARKVAILGLGVEGVSSAAFFHKKGAKIWILDKRQKDDIDQNLLSSVDGYNAQFVLGKNYLDDLTEYDIIVRSPGVKLSLPELIQAKENGVIITSQTKLFFDLCPAKIIGVTGTKGKGTTSSLIYEMLKKDGRDVYLGGNIGTPPFDFLDKLTGQSWVVLELSSFQLQDIHNPPSHNASEGQGVPHIAVLLMITSEHLDYHATVEEYIDAKRNLLRGQTLNDFAVINRDYPASHESDILTDAKVFRFSRERETDNGCFASGGKIIIRKNGNDQEIINIQDIFLPGKHNLENICAAVMAADLAGVGREEISHVLKKFKGLEHRLEFIKEINGVKYYDDSFSTIPETTIAAIEAFKNPEILIMGGSSKHSDFSELGKVIRDTKNIKAIIGIGEEWYRIKEESGIHSASSGQVRNQESGILLIEGARDMKQIVKAASEIAKPGDVVLLSPACASFDMFKNYKDRGEQFKKEVMLLE